MSRLHLTFACEGSTLAATLDTAPLKLDRPGTIFLLAGSKSSTVPWARRYTCSRVPRLPQSRIKAW